MRFCGIQIGVRGLLIGSVVVRLVLLLGEYVRDALAISTNVFAAAAGSMLPHYRIRDARRRHGGSRCYSFGRGSAVTAGRRSVIIKPSAYLH